MNRNILVLFLLILITDFEPLLAQYRLQNAFPELSFDSPVDLQNAGDSSDRIFVVEQKGVINVFGNTPEVSGSKVFLDISDSVVSGGELGLLGLAFDPDYENNGYFYVNYTKSSPLQTRISRFQVTSNPDSADRLSELVMLTFNQPYQNHNGGQIAFGPDGFLYIATGDGGSAGDPQNNAQNLGSLLGKILRIDVHNTSVDLNYAIPPDNPFLPNLSARAEIYAYGLRNPWRFSFDSSGKLWCADVGQRMWEEIDTIQKGGNYGWRILESFHCYNPSEGCDTTGLIPPLYEYFHDTSGGFSVTGGYVYEGDSLTGLKGKYIFADYVSQKIWSLHYASDTATVPIVELIETGGSGISSFGVDENKELYICMFDGSIYKLITITTSVVDYAINPDNFTLYQNFPNPFNPSTAIKYYVPEESFVKIDIIDLTGQIIAELIHKNEKSGLHSFEWNANNFASGVYYIRMNAQSISSNRNYFQAVKAILLK